MALQDRGGAPIAGGSSVATTAYVDAAAPYQYTSDPGEAALPSSYPVGVSILGSSVGAWSISIDAVTVLTVIGASIYRSFQIAVSKTFGTTFSRGVTNSLTWSPWVAAAPLTSPGFGGVPTAPTAANGDVSTQIATTAFSANGRNLTDATVYGQKLALTDYYNLFENPRFDTESGSGWGQTIRGIATNPNARIESPGSLNALSIRGQGGAVNTDTYTTNLIPLVPGDQFWAQWDAATLATGGGGNMRVQIRWLTAAKATLSWSALHADVAQTAMPLYNGTFSTYSGTVTAPASAAYAQLVTTFVGGSTSTTSSVIYLRNIQLKRVATAALVPNATTGTLSYGTGYSATSGRLNSIRLGPDGDVTLNLSVTKSSTIANGDTAATLPVGYRPGATVDMVGMNGVTPVAFQILTSGAVTVAAGGGSGTTLVGSVKFPQVN